MTGLAPTGFFGSQEYSLYDASMDFSLYGLVYRYDLVREYQTNSERLRVQVSLVEKFFFFILFIVSQSQVH